MVIFELEYDGWVVVYYRERLEGNLFYVEGIVCEKLISVF